MACATAIALSIAARPLAQSVVRTADPIKRGLKLSDFPRTIKVTDNVYTYEDFHAGDEKFTTTNMFLVGDDGVMVADGQGSPAETRGLVDAISKVTPKPIKYVVDRLGPRRPHGRQRVLPVRRHLHRASDVESDPRSLG